MTAISVCVYACVCVCMCTYIYIYVCTVTDLLLKFILLLPRLFCMCMPHSIMYSNCTSYVNAMVTSAAGWFYFLVSAGASLWSTTYQAEDRTVT